MSDFLGKLETYPDLEVAIIRKTKIHKVLKGIVKLQSIPKEDEFQFRQRSTELLAKWNKTLADDPNAAAADQDDDAKPEAATANGVAKELEEQVEKAEAGEVAAPEEESAEALEKKIGTTTEGEKEAEKPVEDKKPVEGTKTDEPNIESAPAEAFQPPVEEVEATA